MILYRPDNDTENTKHRHGHETDNITSNSNNTEMNQLRIMQDYYNYYNNQNQALKEQQTGTNINQK